MHVCAIKRAAVIKDAQHNTSQLINITPQICISTGSHSLLKSTCLHFCLCVSIYSPHPHLFQRNPGRHGIIPRRSSKCHRLPLRRCFCARSLWLFHRNIQKDKSKQDEFCFSCSIQTIHGSSSCLWASASSQLANSFRQAASRQLPFFFKAPQAEQIRGPAQFRG